MFNSLSSKLEATFKVLRNRGKLTAEDIDQSLQEIRTALLDADVNVHVVKEFCEAVKKQALGMKVLKSLNPGQMVIKFVHDELIRILGQYTPVSLRHAPPVIIMVVGLQGSGKTTFCAKLAKHLRDENKRRPLLVPADIYRPAAIEQLQILGNSLEIDTFPSDLNAKPLDICESALTYAQRSNLDTVILDTAGRLQIDAPMMNELVGIIQALNPHEVLLVCDAMTGQEAVNVAKGFDSQLDIDGIVITKLDGDARGGAVLSMASVIKKPIKFIGVGEKPDALEAFYPDRLASRILGMGDVLTLIEKAAKHVSLDDAKTLQKKMTKDQFTLQDFCDQMKVMKNMGSMSSMMKMIPGMNQMAQKIDDQQVDKQMKHVEAIILSMTKEERSEADIIDGSRRRRIAKGSGTSVEEVNRLLKDFSEMRKMMKKFGKLGPNGMRGLAGMMKGAMPGFHR
ncbi:MAG: signal recognition particle protein [Deltaproteobacteria bacterium]|nr:signal recognition particle protein [Deltaproteobacteria bacterium]